MDELILYKSEEGEITVNVRFTNETVWLSIDQMAELFQRDKSTISRHISNVFEEGELQRNLVVAKNATTATDGKVYQVDFYNLDVIISVGYRVKSKQGTQFRIWATQRLREYILKGYTLNEERLKSGSSMNYFRELLDKIRDIRLSERLFYQQIKDIYTTSIDYTPSDELTLVFFKEVQNKLLWAVSEKTATELVFYRANAELPLMGLTSTAKEGKVSKADTTIGKNYLQEQELASLKVIVEQYLAYAEAQAIAHRPMYMKDWIEKLSLILTMNERNILTHAGKITHELAVKKAGEEYNKYKERIKQTQSLENIKELDRDLKLLDNKTRA